MGTGASSEMGTMVNSDMEAVVTDTFQHGTATCFWRL